MSNTPTTRLVNELEGTLRTLVEEHRRLAQVVDAQFAAMRRLDAPGMELAAQQQQQLRTRIGAIETRRKLLVAQIARALRLDDNVTISRLAELHPQNKRSLLALRDELREVAAAIAGKSAVSGRVAGAVLGHLNTMIRLVAGATQQGGMYTKQGSPRLVSRIGVMEAVA